MEAGDYTSSNINSIGIMNTPKIIRWGGDWNQFKRLFKATARLNGVADAIAAGELKAQGCLKQEMQYTSKLEIETEIEVQHGLENEAMQNRALQQSAKLAALITLSIGVSEGPQRSIVMEELDESEDGITAWAKLVQHFERSTQDLRLDTLLSEWEHEELKVGEHPDELFARLSTLNRRLTALGEGFTPQVTVRRFVNAIEKQKNHPYKGVLQQHRGQMIKGKPYTLDELREFLAYVYATEENRRETELGAAMKCSFCTKEGHKEWECWAKNPELKRGHREMAKAPRPKKGDHRRQLRCYNCGKKGHLKRECTAPSRMENIAMSAEHSGASNAENYPAMVDSGCSVHLVKDVALLDAGSVKETTGSLCLADGNKIQINAVGERTILVGDYTLKLRNTYYAKGLHQNLFSVRAAIQEGAEVSFCEKDPHIMKGGAKIKLIQTEGAWYLPPRASTGQAMLASASWGTWHDRMGHPGNKKLSILASKSEIRITGGKGLPENCTHCLLSKPRRTPVRAAAAPSGNNVVQVDVMSWSTKGWKGEKYAAVFSHRSSKLDAVFIYSRKDEATRALKEYLTNVRPKLAAPPDTIQTDAGAEFLSYEWKQICEDEGIAVRHCPVDHQAMNGQTERSQGILASMTRAMLRARQVPEKYWPLAMKTAAYLKNRTPHDSINGELPIAWALGNQYHGRIKDTKVFGCRAFVSIPKKQRNGKGGDVRWMGMMVGYSQNSPEYLILDPRSGMIRTAYSVVFQEDVCGITGRCVRRRDHQSGQGAGHGDVQKTQTSQPGPPTCDSQPYQSKILGSHADTARESRATDKSQREHSPSMELNEDDMTSNSEQEDLKNKESMQEHGPEREHQGDQKPTQECSPEGEQRNEKEDHATAFAPMQVIEDQLGTLDMCMAVQAAEDGLPRTWRQALSIPHWKRAMATEKEELEIMGAWVLVPKPPHAKVLPGLWRFRAKKDENGQTVRYKARWCVDGSRDYLARPPEAIYSPVAEKTTVRIIFAIAAAEKQKVLQADFPNAYLNADLEEEAYVIQPKGLEIPGHHDHVCLLRKALYGSPVSGKRWHSKLVEAITSLGYIRSSIDHCLFYRNSEGRNELLTIYVDDVLVTSSSGIEFAEKQLDELGNIFAIKKLGVATHMLGMGVHQEAECIMLEQRAYLEGILREADFLDAKPRSTPWDSHHPEDRMELETTHAAIYRRILGQLMYLSTMTRPDIAFAVGRLTSGASSPTRGLWERMKRLLRYLRGTRNFSMRYERIGEAPRMDAYVDSAFAVDPKRGRSITGYVVHLAGGPIHWRSHLQSTVADSPNAAEYIGLYEVAVAGVGIRNLLKEIGVKIGPTTVHEDNDGARRLATDGMGQKRARHLSIKYHFVQDLCKRGEISVHRLPSGDQPADILTKGTHTAKAHGHLVKKLGLVNYPQQDS